MKKDYLSIELRKILPIIVISILVCIIALSTMMTNGRGFYADENHLNSSESDYAENINSVSANSEISNTSDTHFDILSLDGSDPTELIKDVNNYFYFYNTFEGYYLFKMLSSNTQIEITMHVLENNQTYVNEIESVVLPSLEDSVGSVNAFKFKMNANSDYQINIKYSNVYVGDDNKIDALVSLSSWKKFDTIKINSEIIFSNEIPKNGTHIYIDELYDLAFEYNGGLSPESSPPDLWVASVGMGSLITKESSTFSVKNDSSNEGKILTLEFLDHESSYTINFIIKRQSYAKINFDTKTYQVMLEFEDSYGNIQNSSEASFKSMEIKFGNHGVNTTDNLYNIMTMPVLTSNAVLNVDVKFEVNNKEYIQTLDTVQVNNSRLNIGSFTGAGSDQRIILYGASSNKIISINNDVKVVFFDTSSSYENLRLDIDVNHEIDIFFNEIKLNATDGFIIDSESSNLNIHLSGSNSIKGTSDDFLIQANGVTFKGSGSLKATGEHGTNGANGTDSSKNGGYGTNGINVISCSSYSNECNSVTLRGGDGGNGGNGVSFTANGNTGGNGGKGGNSGIGLAIGSSYSHRGYAGRGGNGGNGGNGSNGTSASIVNGYLTFPNSVSNSTAGSNGGYGGDAGGNGEGVLKSGISYPRGGNGGNGGDGGSGASAMVTTSKNPTTGKLYFMYLFENPSIGGAGGSGGDGYIGGAGGSGGKGGNGFAGADAIWSGPSGSDGGTGAAGGSAGNGGNSWLNSSNIGWAGGRGTGGTGGSAGNGILASYVDGQNGAYGSYGSNGVYAEYVEPACVTEGTLITLADGSQVAVEDLTGNEMLLVWNMMTGEFEAAPILFIDSDTRTSYEVINLYFSDGTVVQAIYEHAFWNSSLNRYTFLRSDAAKYIGDSFNKQTYDSEGNMVWTNVQLVGVEITNEVTTAWSPVTYSHLCYYVNGMLSMPGGTTGLINIFEADPETMTIDIDAYNADIAEYGLFTYEEFAEIYPVSEMVFNAFDVQYFKVAIGKGILTYEMIENLLATYSDFLS